MDTVIGDSVYRDNKAIIVQFKGRRQVLSTSALNGGYCEHLTHIFNYDEKSNGNDFCEMRADTYEEHLAQIAEELSLSKDSASGLSTAAAMKNAAFASERFNKTAVNAIATGGINENGGRVSDPAAWDQAADGQHAVKPGTVNIFLFINARLSKGAIARALVTATEAKTAAVQELMVPSRYSCGLATGSGTDGMIVVADAEASLCLTDAGKHSKLGELIGKAVKRAVKEALFLQTGLNADFQRNIVARMGRFGISEELLAQGYRRICADRIDGGFHTAYEAVASDRDLVTLSSLYAHLLDQRQWGLISDEDAAKHCGYLLKVIAEDSGAETVSTADLTASYADAVVRRIIKRR